MLAVTRRPLSAGRLKCRQRNVENDGARNSNFDAHRAPVMPVAARASIRAPITFA